LRALLSVSDREGIVELARGLKEAGIDCYATDGTHRHLGENGIEVNPVTDLTDSPEILGGRVKTLHPNIFAALLARRDQPDHLAQLAEHGVEQIDIVVVNLYPFAETVRKAETTLDQALEQIDIGGVALLRAAAKNFPGVAAVSDKTQYASVLRDLKAQGTVSPETRQKLAAEAFALTAAYDAQVASYLNQQAGTLFPSRLTLVVEKKADLRYGENPHQLGAFYADPGQRGPTIASAHQIAGKDLSFNNLLDLDAAWGIASDFKTPTVGQVPERLRGIGPALGEDDRRAAVHRDRNVPVARNRHVGCPSDDRDHVFDRDSDPRIRPVQHEPRPIAVVAHQVERLHAQLGVLERQRIEHPDDADVG
jgi:phosphoribosylaminoimidazolecarboxamide formyltransferase/IMP cyclohydrolase